MLNLLFALAFQGTPMSDRIPGVPFTRAEYVQAQMQVHPPAEAEAHAARLYDAPERIGATLMDGDLLLLALVSDDLAGRVIAFRPSLGATVRVFRQHRERALREWRSAL